jgi:hypothetical protein
MWKKITAVILLMAFATSTFCNAIIIMDYYTNTNAFAKNCINKARPAMHCNGKCQMMKKLQQEEKRDQRNSERKAGSKIQEISSKSFFGGLSKATFTGECCYADIHIHKPIDRTYALLRPPLQA